jgi:hypothetical protein
MCAHVGTLVAALDALRAFETEQKVLRRRYRHLAQWFAVNFSPARGTFKIVSLKPRKFVRIALAAAEAFGGKGDASSGSFAIGKNLSGGVLITHKQRSIKQPIL